MKPDTLENHHCGLKTEEEVFEYVKDKFKNYDLMFQDSCKFFLVKK